MANNSRRGEKKRIEQAEYRFSIDAYTPATMPMARLAEYLTQLASLLGEPSAVHFDRLEEGSTVPVLRIEREALPKVRERAIAVKSGDGPRDAITAYKTVNRLLREDNATAVLKDRRRGGPAILYFPGREEAEERFHSVRQQGSIDGIVMRVGGVDDTVPVLLQSDGKQVVGCNANRALAKELAKRLFEPVRLYGIGRWRRDAEGDWSLDTFKVEGFEALKDTPLSIALKRVREVGGEWPSQSYDELGIVRHGKPEGGHGSH